MDRSVALAVVGFCIKKKKKIMHLFRSYNYKVVPDRSSGKQRPTVRGISWTPLPENLDSNGTMKQFISDRILKAARVVYNGLMERNPALIRDRKHHMKTYRQCCSGKELVDWLLKLNEGNQSRSQAVGMWQVLVDERILVHVKQELNFHDKDTQFYRFLESMFSQDPMKSTERDPAERDPAERDPAECDPERDSEDELQEGLSLLSQMGPDALLTMILRKLSVPFISSLNALWSWMSYDFAYVRGEKNQ